MENTIYESFLKKEENSTSGCHLEVGQDKF